jgi:anti-sigma regulatory factor (Ser/Thr protein kinase)
VSAVEAFRHEALLYAGMPDFLDGTASFIQDGVAAGEPVLVVVAARKIELLRARLGGTPDGVRFADMAEVGSNPARIIPAWRDFVEAQAGAGRRLRGIGEPMWRERTPVERVECHRHEALLKVAFAGAPAWWLLCPYDTTTLEAEVIEEAQRTHPFVSQAGRSWESRGYLGLEQAAGPFGAPLPEPGGDVRALAFAAGSLARVRRFVSLEAARAGLRPSRVADLALAAGELAANSVRHGGGRGTLRLWREPDLGVCEVSDGGRLDGALVDRERPGPELAARRGLWLVNQLCDLVQVRTFPTGTAVRLHLRR